jgi:hypothetical protein
MTRKRPPREFDLSDIPTPASLREMLLAETDRTLVMLIRDAGGAQPADEPVE